MGTVYRLLMLSSACPSVRACVRARAWGWGGGRAARQRASPAYSKLYKASRPRTAVAGGTAEQVSVFSLPESGTKEAASVATRAGMGLVVRITRPTAVSTQSVRLPPREAFASQQAPPHAKLANEPKTCGLLSVGSSSTRLD